MFSGAQGQQCTRLHRRAGGAAVPSFHSPALVAGPPFWPLRRFPALFGAAAIPVSVRGVVWVWGACWQCVRRGSTLPREGSQLPLAASGSPTPPSPLALVSPPLHGQPPRLRRACVADLRARPPPLGCVCAPLVFRPLRACAAARRGRRSAVGSRTVAWLPPPPKPSGFFSFLAPLAGSSSRAFG